MNITSALKAQMESDIAACESHTERNGSEALYSELVARYTVLDPSFKNGLSTNGKAAAIGSEFDYRQELRAIASKLRMYLLIGDLNDSQYHPLQKRVSDFIARGDEIEKKENTTPGMPVKVIAGPDFETWINEIEIFNKRHLKSHPLYNAIKSTCFHRKNISAFNDMMGHLKALAADVDFWRETAPKENTMVTRSRKTIDQLLAEDIERCEHYLDHPDNETVGQKLYIEITGRYDGVIAGFGNGLYQYYADLHFYDPEVSGESLIHNLRVLHGKMVSYQAIHFPATIIDTRGRKTTMLYDVFISHANADKIEYVDQLKQSLDKLRIGVFYDKDTLEWGDKWKDKILEGVKQAEFAIIVISENFFGREWTEKELHEFLNRQNSSGQKIILPILHNITAAQLKEKYPAVADIQGLSSENYSCDEIALLFAGQLIKRLKA